MQIDLLAVTVRIRIAVIFLHEQFRSGQTKTINALFYIAYHKQVVFPFFLSGHCCQDCLLYIIAVLVLIYHDLGKLLPIFFCRSSRFTGLFVHQNPQCKMLNIRKIDHISICLRFCKPFQKLFCQIHQFLHNWTFFHDHFQLFFLRIRKIIFFYTIQVLLHFIP